MEGSFDQDLLVFERKEPRNVHKKPSHMSSVAGGIRKRLQDSIQHRRSVRLSGFDQGRDIPHDVHPTPIKEVRSEAELKVEHRRQQLEKWKVEKAQRKKEEAMQKKKPFVAGIPHAPLYALPPPPTSKVAPSTSGRVTRSSARKVVEAKAVPKTMPKTKPETQPFTKSFAPSNATFKPPKMIKAITIPPYTLNNNKPKITITFNPVIHPSRSNANASTASSSEDSSTMLNDDKPKRKFVKTPMKFTKYITSSSSDSDHAAIGNFKRNVQTRGMPRKVQIQTSSDSSSTDNSKSSKQADIQKTKSTKQADVKITRQNITKPLPPQVKASTSKAETIRTVKESPNIEKRPIRAAKLKALTSIELQRANKNKTKIVVTRVNELSPQASNTTIETRPGTSKTKTSSQVKELSPVVIMDRLNTERPKSTSKPSCDVTPRKTERKSLANKNSTPKRPIPKSESSSEERIRVTPKDASSLSTPTSLDSSSSAGNLSPFVCVSRGKDNARKEMLQKAREGLLGAALEDEEDSVSYFRQLLETEVQKISLACDRWDGIYDEVLPEFVQGLVLSAVGQGRLLMRQKFLQFVSLIDRCANDDAKVTVTDLRGFWDMIYLQVKNIDHRFAELEELRAKNWSIELHQFQQRPAAARDSQDPAKKPGDPAKKKAGVGSRKNRVTAGPSKIKEMIAAARKAKQQQDSSTYSTSSSTATLSLDNPAEAEEKTFEAGFFSVRSPIRSPRTPATPAAANRSLLQSVLSSEARKACGSCSKNTSNAMLRASILGKNFEIEGVSPLAQTPKPIPINLNATPARSILKSGKKHSLKKSSKKSIKTVLFDQNESDDCILVSNQTSGSYPMDVTTEVNKENDVVYVTATESVEKIDSVKKSARKSIEVTKTRKSGGNPSESETARKSVDKSMDMAETTKNSDNTIEAVKSTKSTGKRYPLQHQNALVSSPLMTRRQRKSLQPFLVDDSTVTPQNTVFKEFDNLTPNSTSSFEVFDVTNKPTPRRSKRLTQINSDDDLIKFDSPVKIVARRSSKRRVN